LVVREIPGGKNVAGQIIQLLITWHRSTCIGTAKLTGMQAVSVPTMEGGGCHPSG